ncbi:hypothetical protein [Bacteroides sp. 224]|uniref:hypothetical protein n=1 Tax=Bacteroides sp. 224 TaxID=2302936 RepID=UPI0013D58224|nr:hypothetical protein [Bacteroides sp. 224]NDV64852.1 hypothetical protein [Bacteroides sp. 224]
MHKDETVDSCINIASVYYWKTVFSLNEYEQKFLQKNHIRKIYLRFFDVDYEYDERMVKSTIPVGTLIFKDSIPENIEIVPTIFITNEAMRIGDPQLLVAKILNRIEKMANTNDLPQIREIQFDCDWTRSTQQNYFDFLQNAKEELMQKTISLSVTIRLHQLKMPVPPVDKGVLMCYNTGNIKAKDTENSILDVNDVQPYVKGLSQYNLPLAIAYPTFSWVIGFRNEEFLSLFRKVNVKDSTLYENTVASAYKVVKDHYLEDKWVRSGDMLRLEESSYETLRKVKETVKEYYPSLMNEVILYHLDSINLSKYTDHEIQTLYSN